MSMFKDMLKDDESLFKNDIALDFSFMPKLVPYREKEQFYIASCIKPLFQKRNGKNVLVHGKPGIGKTVAVKHIFKELEEETEEVLPLYVNCWQKNTTYKIAIELCEKIGYAFTQNKKTEELFKVLIDKFNKTNLAFCFDEIDKAEDFQFLYTILEEVYRKSIIMVSNHKEWLISLDQRIKSRLAPELLDFRVYNEKETKGILQKRMEYAFVPNVWDMDGFNKIIAKSFEYQDIRTGLHLMRQAGNIAEQESSKKILIAHVEKALASLDELALKEPLELEDEKKLILNIVKLNDGKKIGDLYKIYRDNAGNNSYKTFQRNLERLAKGKFIVLKKKTGGAEGSTTFVYYQSVKKLTEF